METEIDIIPLEWVENWNNKGKSEIENLINSQNDTSELGRLLYSLVHCVIQEKLNSNQLISFLKENKGELMESILADIVWLAAKELKSDKDKYSQFVKFVTKMVKEEVLSKSIAKERFPYELMTETDVVSVQRDQRNPIYVFDVRLKTKQRYRQHKYNLLGEVAEGYSKLLVELFDFNENLIATAEKQNKNNINENHDNSIAATRQRLVDQIRVRIRHTIGYFDLDPNRVIDVVMEVAESIFSEYSEILHHNNQIKEQLFNSYIQVLDLFSVENVKSLLLFKFNLLSKYTSSSLPSGLFEATALLTKQNLLDINDIYPYLSPKDDKAKQQYQIYIKNANTKAKTAGKVVQGSPDKEKVEELKEPPSVHKNNQKFELIIALLKYQSLTQVNKVLTHLNELRPASYPRMAEALCSAINNLIDPLYKRISFEWQLIKEEEVPSNLNETESKALVMFKEHIGSLLVHLGCYIYTDICLFTKLIRVLKHYFTSLSGLESQMVSELSEQSWTIILHNIMSGLILTKQNTGLVTEIWELMHTFDYHTRFRIYGGIQNYAYASNPLLLAQKYLISAETGMILRRLSKDNTKVQGRSLMKLGISNPVIVASKMMDTAKAYENLIQFVVDTMRYANPLFQDVMVFIIIDCLSKDDTQLKSDGITLSEGLLNVSKFVGYLYRRNLPTIEPLFQYIINRLKSGQWEELVLLQELFKCVARIDIEEDISDEQLEAHAGGPLLRIEAGGFSSTRANINNASAIHKSRRATEHICEVLKKTGMVKTLLVLLGKLRATVSFVKDEELDPTLQLKGVLFSHSRCHLALLYLLRFLSDNMSYFEDTLYIDNVGLLVDSYKLETEVAFAILRLTLKERPGTYERVGEVKPLYYSALESKEDKTEDKIEDKQVDEKMKDENEEQKQDKDGELETKESIEEDNKTDKNETKEESETKEEKEQGKEDKQEVPSISPDLYRIFWTMELYDLHRPDTAYNREISQLKEAAQSDQVPEKKKRSIRDIYSRLVKEQEKHEKDQTQVMERLKDSKVKDKLVNENVSHSTMVIDFIQHCVLPRSLFSLVDAVYAAHFVQVLHSLRTPFHTLRYLNTLFNGIQGWLLSCTESEAQRIGLFLSHTLEMLNGWKNSNSFEEHCQNHPGFRRSNGTSFQYNDYIFVHSKWHGKVAKAFAASLERDRPMDQRNALIMLSKMANVFPHYIEDAQLLQPGVDSLVEHPRNDLKTLAVSLKQRLSKADSNLVHKPKSSTGPKSPPSLSSMSSAGEKERKRERSSSKRDHHLDSTSSNTDTYRKHAESRSRSSSRSSQRSTSNREYSSRRSSHSRSPPHPDSSRAPSSSSSIKEVSRKRSISPSSSAVMPSSKRRRYDERESSPVSTSSRKSESRSSRKRDREYGENLGEERASKRRRSNSSDRESRRSKESSPISTVTEKESSSTTRRGRSRDRDRGTTIAASSSSTRRHAGSEQYPSSHRHAPPPFPHHHHSSPPPPSSSVAATSSTTRYYEDDSADPYYYYPQRHSYQYHQDSSRGGSHYRQSSSYSRERSKSREPQEEEELRAMLLRQQKSSNNHTSDIQEKSTSRRSDRDRDKEQNGEERKSSRREERSKEKPSTTTTTTASSSSVSSSVSSGRVESTTNNGSSGGGVTSTRSSSSRRRLDRKFLSKRK